ncbi:hypothetical protein HOY82DRAFT_557767 [Tuber indicum]|nr:hypothetical protein HOY82DRAFT_557767 [Tuber indicum]
MVRVPLQALAPETLEHLFHITDGSLGTVGGNICAIKWRLETLEFQGGGMYDTRNDYQATTSTVFLFAFTPARSVAISVVCSIVLRAFTKLILWFISTINITTDICGAIHYVLMGDNLARLATFSLVFIVCVSLPPLPISLTHTIMIAA